MRKRKRVYTNEELTNAVNNLIIYIEKMQGAFISVLREQKFEVEDLQKEINKPTIFIKR